MNKSIVLPSGYFVISRIRWGMVGGCITRVSGSEGLTIPEYDLLPLARALIEIYEGIKAEKEEAEAACLREAGEPVKGT